jgi:hypothetical protein
MDSQEAAFKKIFDMEWHEPTVKDSCLYLPRRRQAYLEYLDVWRAALLYASQQQSERDKKISSLLAEYESKNLNSLWCITEVVKIWNEAKDEKLSAQH